MLHNLSDLLFNSISNMRVIKVSSTSLMWLCDCVCVCVFLGAFIDLFAHRFAVSFSFSNFNSEKLNTKSDSKYKIFNMWKVRCVFVIFVWILPLEWGGWGRRFCFSFSVFVSFFVLLFFLWKEKTKFKVAEKWFQYFILVVEMKEQH